MDSHWNSLLGTRISRREMLQASSCGFGSLALAGLLADEAKARVPGESDNPLAQKAPHFPSRAKRIIFLFMHGGPSQVDTFDYKPLLQRDHGKPFPYERPRVVSSETFNLLKSPWAFKQYGESGQWVSELFPHVAEFVDDLCFIKSMHASNSRHGAALLELHTGSDTFVRPSIGSWLTYGLGSENQDMPGFITVCPTQGHGGANNYGSAFLPAPYAGTAIGTSRIQAKDARIPFITNDQVPRDIQRKHLDFIREMNQQQLTRTGPDRSLEGRIQAFELAFRMQAQAPGLQDLSLESDATRKLYGLGRPDDRGFRPPVPDGEASGRGGGPLRAGESQLQVGSAPAAAPRSHPERPGSGQAHRRPAPRPQGERPVAGHAGPLGGRVRTHTGGPGIRRPGPQSPGIHHVDGRRGREARLFLRRHGRLRLLLHGEQGAHSTICTPPFCTSWAWTILSSPIATREGIFASPISTAT